MRRLMVLAFVLAAAAPAQAAWSPPVRLGRPAQSPRIVMAGDGHSLITGYGNHGTQLVTLAPGGMEPVARRTVSDYPYFLTYGRQTTIGFRASAGAVFGSITDPFARSQPITGAADLAVSPRGEAVAMWLEARGRVTLTRYSIRPPGGRFLKPRTIAVARSDREFPELAESGEIGAAIAIDGDGDVVVALIHESGENSTRKRQVRVVTIPRGGRPGPQQTLGPHNGLAYVGLALARNGRTLIAWKTSDGGEEVNLPIEVWAATREPGARRFRRAQQLEGGGSPPSITQGHSDLAIGADGEALVTWSTSARRSRRYPVEIASAPPGQRFGRPQVVGSDGIDVDVAVTPDGRAALAWTTTSDDPQTGIQVFAALRPARGAPFGPPEPVSPPEAAESPVVAYDPSTGQPLIAWSATPGAPDGHIEHTEGTPAPRSLSIARFAP